MRSTLWWWLLDPRGAWLAWRWDRRERRFPRHDLRLVAEWEARWGPFNVALVDPGT